MDTWLIVLLIVLSAAVLAALFVLIAQVRKQAIGTASVATVSGTVTPPQLAGGRHTDTTLDEQIPEASTAATGVSARAATATPPSDTAPGQGSETASATELATIAAARAELNQLRESLAEEKARMIRTVEAQLELDRAEMEAAADRLHAAQESLAEDRAQLARDRERLRNDRADLHTERGSLVNLQELLRTDRIRLDEREEELTRRDGQLNDAEQQLGAELSRLAELTVAEARAELLAKQEEHIQRDAALLARRIESEAVASARDRARKVVADAVQRVASDQTAQTVVCVVPLPSDDIKGRIIGREGRNIRAFESITGVNAVIDDTPEAVLLSCFDPVRREIGRATLEMLVEDGRIHPHRIEEAYERAGAEVEDRCARAARDAMADVGIYDLHPELIKLLGQLTFRTSYGQNVLGHLVECSHIARNMAAELGIDPTVAARGAFLHDIGKALTHEAQGSHAELGADLARRYGESDEVVHCIQAHHDEVAPATVEAVLTQAADACSGGRPGARRESLEAYVQRLERIESIASAKDGVDKVFAMQAGRDLRVMVKPEVVDDLQAQVLAREVAKQIEEELTYPGQVRVTVIRESRAIEVAR